MNIRERIISTTIDGIDFTFKTSSDLFSPRYVDKSTLAMLARIEFSDAEKVLDLGCGYGDVGIWAAKRLGPHTVAVHAKDMEACRHVSPAEWYFFSSVTVGTGLIDMPGVVKALEDSSFAGVLAVESDHHKDNQDEIELVANSVAYLKELLG